MNSLKLLFCHSILLVILCRSCLGQANHIIMATTRVEVIDGSKANRLFLGELLAKTSPDLDEYFFSNDDLMALIGGKFTSEAIEIIHAFDRTLEFALITADNNFAITCEFLSNLDLQLFFSEIRKTELIEATDHCVVFKSFQFSAIAIAEIANHNIFYRKKIDKIQEVGATDSYNLVRVYRKLDPQTGAITQVQEADLVFASRQFNITPLFEGDKFGLCVRRVPNRSIFILRFTDRMQALRFFATVVNDVNFQIPCSLDKDWVDERLQYIEDPTPFHLPLLPYLGETLF